MLLAILNTQIPLSLTNRTMFAQRASSSRSQVLTIKASSYSLPLESTKKCCYFRFLSMQSSLLFSLPKRPLIPHLMTTPGEQEHLNIKNPRSLTPISTVLPLSRALSVVVTKTTSVALALNRVLPRTACPIAIANQNAIRAGARSGPQVRSAL